MADFSPLLTRRRTFQWALALGVGLSFPAYAAKRAVQTDYRAEVGAQAPRKSIQLDGVPITYSDTGGAGSVIICLHAIGHGARDYQDLSRRIGKDFRVIAIDFPGQGGSGDDHLPASGTRYTQLLTLFVDKLHLKSVIILGNSIGGATAVRYAGLHPDRVKALVLCDSGGLTPAPDAQSQKYIQNFVDLFETGAKGDPAFADKFDKYYKTVLIEPPAFEERARIIRAAYETAPVLVEAWQSFARPEESLWDVLPNVKCPVLLAWAKDDGIISLGANKASFERFPNHRLEIFAGGHAAFLEDPDHFEQTLRQFLASA